jgi:hypothetical protein
VLLQALRTAVLALALARQMHELQLVLRIVAPTAALLDASISAPYSSLRKHLVLLLVGLEAQPLPLAEWNVAAEFKVRHVHVLVHPAPLKTQLHVVVVVVDSDKAVHIQRCFFPPCSLYTWRGT